jgi:hypothetical protein
LFRVLLFKEICFKKSSKIAKKKSKSNSKCILSVWLYRVLLFKEICLNFYKNNKIKENTNKIVNIYIMTLCMFGYTGFFYNYKNSKKNIQKVQNITLYVWSYMVLLLKEICFKIIKIAKKTFKKFK